MSEPENGVPFEYFTTLDDFGLGSFVQNPTIDPGDFQITKDGSPFVNLATTPVVIPAGSVNVRVNLSAAEMTAQNLNVVGVDVTGQQWRDISAAISPDETPTIPNKILDIVEGDHIETRDRSQIFKRNTNTIVLDKKIKGSLLRSGTTITTEDSP